MGSKQHPITRPVPPCSYRLLGIKDGGVYVVTDFRAARRPAAERAASSPELKASALFNTEGRVIFGVMPKEEIANFQEAFSFEPSACSCV